MAPVTVVQKKEVKKIAPPKGKENVSCVQRKLRRVNITKFYRSNNNVMLKV